MSCKGCRKHESKIVLSNDKGYEEFRWCSLCPRCERAIQRVGNGWLKTGYQAGQRVKGGKTDCAQLMFGMLDELFGHQAPSPMPRFCPDAAVHDPRPFAAVVLAGKKAFGLQTVRDGTIEPGDVILTRATEGSTPAPRRPGHALIVMPRKGTAIHAIPNTGVTITSLTVNHGILRILRPSNKHKWVTLQD